MTSLAQSYGRTHHGLQCNVRDGQVAKRLCPVDSMNATFHNKTDKESEYKYVIVEENEENSGDYIVL